MTVRVHMLGDSGSWIEYEANFLVNDQAEAQEKGREFSEIVEAFRQGSCEGEGE